MTERTAKERIEQELKDSDRPIDATEEQPLTADPPPDRTRQFTHTGLSRMPMRWKDDDELALQVIEATVSDIIKSEFGVAFKIIERLRRYVRVQAKDPETGEPMAFSDGTPKWEVDEDGVPVEHWSSLGDRERTNAVYTLGSYMFEWELRAGEKWARAMFSKVNWEEKFAKNFTVLPDNAVQGKPTIDDRTQWGHRMAIEERYFAIFQAALSRQADRLVQAATRFQVLLERTMPR